MTAATRRWLLSVCVVLGCVSGAPLAWADDTPVAWPLHQRKIADYVSTGLVVGQLTAAAIDDWRCTLVHTGIAVGIAEPIKLLVQKRRPDGSDFKSFPSEHTFITGANSGWRYSVGIPLTIGAGYLRMAANKHDIIDTAVGGLAGLFASRVCR